jgi:phosphorylcholine metabolism protein LicD
MGLPEEEVRRHFGSVTAVDTVRSKYAMPYENNVPLFLCRRPARTLQEAWPEVKHYE